MSGIDNFLNSNKIPKWVKVSRSRETINFTAKNDSIFKLVIAILASIACSYALITLSRVILKHVLFDPRYPLQNTALNVLTWFLVLAIVFITAFFLCDKVLQKFVIRVDSKTGNFSLANQSVISGFETNFKKFDRDTVIPVVRESIRRDRYGNTSVNYSLEIYPNLRTYREGPGLLISTPDVFILSDWERKRCEWLRSLLLAIREKPLTSAEQEDIYHFMAGNDIHAKKESNFFDDLK